MIVAEDVNNDGFKDLIVSGTGALNNRLNLYLNQGNGLFASPICFGTNLLTSGGIANYGSSAMADIDNDGDLDLIITGVNSLGLYRLQKYINDGEGNFSEPVPFGTGVNGASITLGDIDNDGDLDLIVTGNNGGYRLDKYINDGLGNFSGTSFGTGVTYSSVALGDINNDGNLDLIVSGYNGSYTLYKYINDGLGNFSGTSFGTGEIYCSIALGDINNDGNLDLIVSGIDSGATARLYKYINDGIGNFVQTIFPTGIAASSICLGDINNDGNLDLVVTGTMNWGTSAGRRIDKYINSGTGNFTSSAINGMGVIWSSIVLADVNNDNNLDLLITGTTNFGGSGVSRFDKYINLETVPNTSPSEPFKLYSLPVGNFWGLKWDAPLDDHTPQNMLRYKIAIRTNNSNVSNYISTNIDFPRGQANVGNVPLSSQQYFQTSIPVKKTIYWKVCAIDSALQAGFYSSEQTATLKPNLIYPVGTSISSLRPVFNWKKKYVETNIIQISTVSSNMTSILFQTNLGPATNFASTVDLTNAKVWWRVIGYRQSCQTSFTSASAWFTTDRTNPVIGFDKASGSYSGPLGIKINVYQNSLKTTLDTNALLIGTVTKDSILQSSYTQQAGILVNLTVPGIYHMQFYARDSAGNSGMQVSADYTVVNSIAVDKAAVYPTLLNLNKDHTVKFVSGEKSSNVDIQIFTLKGVLIKTLSGINMSTGVYEWTVDYPGLFPAGTYMVKIGKLKAYFSVVK
jgi:hypothetical protein